MTFSATRWAVRLAIALTLGLATNSTLAEPVRIPLWEKGAPGEPATKAEDEPVLFLHQPSEGTPGGAAIVVCPGGSYAGLAITYEGHDVAQWFNTFGVTAFVLKYRLSASGHRHPVPMLDGQQAICTVRARAGEWGIDPAKFGVIGFSAGGHLASTLSTHFDAGDLNAEDAVDRASSRPDFAILCYPVISMSQPFMHRGSRDNLLGKEANFGLEQDLSNDLQFSPQTPPTFIFQTDEDKPVPAENCVAYYLALRRAGVPAELHIYERGPHGVGLGRDILGTNTWPQRCREWMASRGLVELDRADVDN